MPDPTPATTLDADLLCEWSDNDRHLWQPGDPEHLGEGLMCAWCGVTEAEMEGDSDEF